MKKVIAYGISAALCILGCMAALNGSNRECVLLFGISLSIDCLLDISEQNFNVKVIGYPIIILAVIAGFIMNPLIPDIASVIILIGFEFCDCFGKQRHDNYQS